MNIIEKIKIKFLFYFIKDFKELVEYHFKYFSEYNHINKTMFLKLFEYFNNNPISIFETGSSAWGTNSSVLFDSYIKKFGGNFITVDIRKEPSEKLNKIFSKNSKAFVGDSLDFIKNYKKNELKKVDLVYLDSFDVDFKNPEPAMEHGLNEFLYLDKLVSPGTLIAIDDTPKDIKLYGENFTNEKKYNNNFIPGKGTYILENIKESKKYEIVYHHYSLIIKKIN